MNEKLVCGKCGSSSVNVAESLSTDGWSGEIASCWKCGNTSESKKYGFHRGENRHLEGSHKPFSVGSTPPPATTAVIPDVIRNPGTKIKEEEKTMALKGDCGNCPRKDVPISKCNPPLCWTCQKAAQGLKGDDREMALVDIRERIIVGDMPRPGGRGSKHVKVEEKTKKDTKKGAIEKGSRPQEAPKVERKANDKVPTLLSSVLAGDVIMLNFDTDFDRKLLKAIEVWAEQYRRTPDQQILWFCQNNINLLTELLKEAAPTGSECG